MHIPSIIRFIAMATCFTFTVTTVTQSAPLAQTAAPVVATAPQATNLAPEALSRVLLQSMDPESRVASSGLPNDQLITNHQSLITEYKANNDLKSLTAILTGDYPAEVKQQAQEAINQIVAERKASDEARIAGLKQAVDSYVLKHDAKGLNAYMRSTVMPEKNAELSAYAQQGLVAIAAWKKDVKPVLDRIVRLEKAFDLAELRSLEASANAEIAEAANAARVRCAGVIMDRKKDCDTAFKNVDTATILALMNHESREVQLYATGIRDQMNAYIDSARTKIAEAALAGDIVTVIGYQKDSYKDVVEFATQKRAEMALKISDERKKIYFARSIGDIPQIEQFLNSIYEPVRQYAQKVVEQLKTEIDALLSTIAEHEKNGDVTALHVLREHAYGVVSAAAHEAVVRVNAMINDAVAEIKSGEEANDVAGLRGYAEHAFPQINEPAKKALVEVFWRAHLILIDSAQPTSKRIAACDVLVAFASPEAIDTLSKVMDVECENTDLTLYQHVVNGYMTIVNSDPESRSASFGPESSSGLNATQNAARSTQNPNAGTLQSGAIATLGAVLVATTHFLEWSLAGKMLCIGSVVACVAWIVYFVRKAVRDWRNDGADENSMLISSVLPVAIVAGFFGPWYTKAAVIGAVATALVYLIVKVTKKRMKSSDPEYRSASSGLSQKAEPGTQSQNAGKIQSGESSAIVGEGKNAGSELSSGLRSAQDSEIADVSSSDDYQPKDNYSLRMLLQDEMRAGLGYFDRKDGDSHLLATRPGVVNAVKSEQVKTVNNKSESGTSAVHSSLFTIHPGLSVNVYYYPDLKHLGEHNYHPESGELIYLHPAAQGNALLQRGVVLHEMVHGKLESLPVSETVEDIVAATIEMRYVLRESYRQDIAQGLQPGTTLQGVVDFLKNEEAIVFQPLKHLLNQFRVASGARLEKQIQVITPFAVMRHNGVAADTAPAEIAQMVLQIEAEWFGMDVDAEIAQYQEAILSDAASELAAKSETTPAKPRAVVLDNVADLDQAVVEKFVNNENRFLYVLDRSEGVNTLMQVAVTNGIMSLKNTGMTVKGLEETVQFFKADGKDVSIISNKHNEMVRINEKDALLFSTKKVKESAFKDLPFEMLILPFAFNCTAAEIDQQAGVNKLFVKAGKLIQVNLDYVMNFGDTLGAAFQHVMKILGEAMQTNLMQKMVRIAA